jgi:hypothetical protein
VQRKSFIFISIVGLTAMAMPQLDCASRNREIKKNLIPPSFLSRICDAKTIADCKVHGIANLFIAGSSCFVTAAAPNPTLTLIALSIRLSDHLKAKMKRQ